MSQAAENQSEMEKPSGSKVNIQEVNWDDNMLMQPEISFGQYCNEKFKKNNIREVFKNASPPKKKILFPPVELSDSFMRNRLIKDGKIDQNYLENLISK